MAMFVRSDSSLSRMEEVPYEAEAVLQGLLVDYPDLLSGDDGGEDAGWLLVQQELGVESEIDSTARWSLDHLFLDRQGIPTLVEVKRSSDTRIRREVVGQMLDYAANGSAIWNVGKIQSSFEAGNENPDSALEDFLKDELSPDEFWAQVDLNLKAGRLRLVFVADAIPPELRRIIEFLNEQMSETEVIGVEVRQFKQTDGDLVNLISQVVGRSEAASRTKGASGTGRGSWTVGQFEEALSRAYPPEMADRVMGLHQRLIDAGAKLTIGTGIKEPSLNYRLAPGTRTPVSLSIYVGGIAINFDFVISSRSDQELRRLLDLANEIPGVAPYLTEVREGHWNQRPTMLFSDVLPDDASVELFARQVIAASRPEVP